MKKVNQLSREELKKVHGGGPPPGGGTENENWMYCYDHDRNLMGPPFEVSDCHVGWWEANCYSQYHWHYSPAFSYCVST